MPRSARLDAAGVLHHIKGNKGDVVENLHFSCGRNQGQGLSEDDLIKRYRSIIALLT
jgi:hypothetical protein